MGAFTRPCPGPAADPFRTKGWAAHAPAHDGPLHEDVFDRAEFIHHALRSLSADHREVLLLRFLEGLSLGEIAQALRCRTGTVKSRLHYAKQALRREVERLVHE